MMINCPKHGFQEGIEVSPDIAEAVAEGWALPERQEIVYEYQDDPALVVLISHSFANEHGVAEEARQPLPDDYPEWHGLLVPACSVCAGYSM